MTTTAYDMHFIASDVAFTDNDGNVRLDIQFRKVKRIGSAVMGMAGCLDCMKDFCVAILNFVLQKTSSIELPQSIIDRQDRDFLAILHLNGSCFKVGKELNGKEYFFENITQIPTVIGSGSDYTRDMIQECPNAVVAVLEAIKHDDYTDGEVKYCSIRRDDIHNLEANPMSTNLKIQIAGLQGEINAVNKLTADGKSFQASTKTFHDGNPSRIPVELGLQFLQQGFSEIREQLAADKETP